MVIYCYNLDDRVIDWLAPMGKAPQSLLVNGRIARRDKRAEMSSARSGDPWTEHESLALMVHPLDVKATRAEAHAKGLNVTVRDNGMVHFDNRSDQKKYCRAYGLVNHDDNWS